MCIRDRVGTAPSRIVLDGLDIMQNGSDADTIWGQIVIRFAELRRGLPFSRWGARKGALTLTDSILRDVGLSDTAIEIALPDGHCTIARNVFQRCGVLSIGVEAPVAIVVENNVFVDKLGPADIENWSLNAAASLTVSKNSFLDVGKIAVRLPDGFENNGMNAVGNYWGTTTDAVVQSMIYDKNDSGLSSAVISYKPILTAKHANTPAAP